MHPDRPPRLPGDRPSWGHARGQESGRLLGGRMALPPPPRVQEYESSSSASPCTRPASRWPRGAAEEQVTPVTNRRARRGRTPVASAGVGVGKDTGRGDHGARSRSAVRRRAELTTTEARRDHRERREDRRQARRATASADAGRVVGERPEQVPAHGGARPARGARRGPGARDRSSPSRLTSAVSRARSVPAPTAIPRSAAASAGASLRPSPTNATRAAAASAPERPDAPRPSSSGRSPPSRGPGREPERAPRARARRPACRPRGSRTRTPVGGERRDGGARPTAAARSRSARRPDRRAPPPRRAT